MAIIHLNGIDIYYELHGKGIPLILIAGYSCDHTFWLPMLPELAKHFQVLIFDNRGIGQTKDDGKSFTLDMMAEDVIQLAGKLNLSCPHLVGHSMGGVIGQLIGKKYQNKINKLVILNSVAKFNERMIKALQSLINLRKENVSLDLQIEAAMPWFFSSAFLSKPENILAFKNAVKNNPYPQSLYDQERQYAVLPEFDSLDWLHEIKSSTLVVAGNEDIIGVPAESQELAKRIPHSHFVVTPDGHSSPLERPEAINKVILEFLI